MLEFLFHLISNALGIYIADYLLDGFNFFGNFGDLLLISFLLALIQFFVRPILKVITFPLILVTFGLFNIFINILLLWILQLIVPKEVMLISGFWNYLAGALIISLINIFINHYLKRV